MRVVSLGGLEGGSSSSSESTRVKINLKRTCSGANDHLFEVVLDAPSKTTATSNCPVESDSDGIVTQTVESEWRKMRGHCPQSGCRWTLRKVGEATE